MKIAVIGGGISGLSAARILGSRYDVTIFEAQNRPGGLIKCDKVEGSLFHRTGGHVFNSKRQDVLDWFWSHFDRDKEFIKAKRNAVVSMSDNSTVPYPIENHIYLFNEETQKSFIKDMLEIASGPKKEPENFKEFLVGRFGKTLYDLYFEPYNYKVWRTDLTKVPLTWLVGKLPMPTTEEMIYSNMNHLQEEKLVHSSFYYAKENGSQFIINRLAEGLNIVCDSPVREMKKQGKQWLIENQLFDKVIYCGNIKKIPLLVKEEIDIRDFVQPISELDSHGTTTAFCEVEEIPYSWVYLPSREHESHRVICTGNFSDTNNAAGKMTATIEFTDYISEEDIIDNLSKIPFAPKMLTYNYEKYTYPIQNKTTKKMIGDLKEVLGKESIYLLGRFAEWEYYNMDTAIGAAMDLDKIL
jgi:protoporphyrinogen oxidase